jgi:hypothetical protein
MATDWTEHYIATLEKIVSSPQETAAAATRIAMAAVSRARYFLYFALGIRSARNLNLDLLIEKTG